MGAYYDVFEEAETDAVVPRTAPWLIYDGPCDELDLDDDVPDEFRLAFVLTSPGTVTLSWGEGDDAEDEVLEFETGTRLVAVAPFTELPEVEIDSAGDVSVECVTPFGAPIMRETLEDIKIIVFPKTSIVRASGGSGSQQTDYNIFSETVLQVGDCIRFYDPLQGRNVEVYVKHIDGGIDLTDGHIEYRMLMCA